MKIKKNITKIGSYVFDNYGYIGDPVISEGIEIIDGRLFDISVIGHIKIPSTLLFKLS